MGLWNEHIKFGFLSLGVLTVVLLIMKQFGSIPFLIDDFSSNFNIHSVGIPIILIAFGLGLYASLLPDIDIGNSKIYQWTVGILLLLCVVFILSDAYKYETIAILLFIVSLFWLDHRGLTHRWWFGLLFAIVIGCVFTSVTVFTYCSVGYYTHLWRDR